MPDLPIIQKTYDLIRWYVPILNRLPRDHTTFNHKVTKTQRGERENSECLGVLVVHCLNQGSATKPTAESHP
jgi:hypothetical protein